MAKKTTSNITSSPFHPDRQLERTDSRTVAALERLSEAFRVLLWRAGKVYKISPIAVQILTFLDYHRAELCTVGYLADEFNMTKQTISDAVLTLESKGFIEKVTHPTDARIAMLRLTKAGKKLSEETSGFATPMEEAVALLNTEQQNEVLSGLLAIIRTLNKQDIVSTQRMCFTCRFYAANHDGKEHFCQLLLQELVTTASSSEHYAVLRLDCEEHEAI